MGNNKNIIVLGGTSGNGGNGGHTTGGGVAIKPEPTGKISHYTTGIQPLCVLKENWKPCGFNVAGIRRLWLVRRSEIDEYYFFPKNDRDRISDIQAAVGNGCLNWYCWKLDRDEGKFTEVKVDTPGGPAFIQRIDLPYSAISFEGRRKLRPVLTVGHAVCFEDSNGRFWLAGESEGMTTGKRLTTTDNINGTNRYEITLEALELRPIREVHSIYVETCIIDKDVNPGDVDGELTVGDLGNVTIKNLNGVALSDFI